MNTPFTRRRRLLQLALRKLRLSTLLVTHPPDWYYLTGFTGEAGVLLISRSGSALITDGRFVTQAREETSGIRILPQKKSLLSSTGKFIRARSAARIGFDPSRLTVDQFRALRRESGPRARWIAAPGQIES